MSLYEAINVKELKGSVALTAASNHGNNSVTN